MNLSDARAQQGHATSSSNPSRRHPPRPTASTAEPMNAASEGQTDFGAHLVEFLLHEGRARRLLADHHANSSGHCTSCTDSLWPCTLHHYATEAAIRAQGRRRASAPERRRPS